MKGKIFTSFESSSSSNFLNSNMYTYWYLEDGKFKDDLGEFYHKPAANISQQKKTDKIKEKLEERRERRKLEHKYALFIYI